MALGVTKDDVLHFGDVENAREIQQLKDLKGGF